MNLQFDEEEIRSIEIQHLQSLGLHGTMLFELTSNTQLKIKVKGSDGTVRTASLTLA